MWRRGSESNRRTRLCRPLHNHSATPPGVQPRAPRKSARPPNEKGKPRFPFHELLKLWQSGAGDESRTRDLNLGKVALYQLSYSRGQPENIAIRSKRVKQRARPASLLAAQIRPGAPQVVHHRPYRENRCEIDQPRTNQSRIEQAEERAIKKQHRNCHELGDGLELAD